MLDKVANKNNIKYNNLDTYNTTQEYNSDYYYPFILNYTIKDHHCYTKVLQLFFPYELPTTPFSEQYNINYKYLCSGKCLQTLISMLYVMPQPKKIVNNIQFDYYYIVLYIISIISNIVETLDDDSKRLLTSKCNRYGNEDWCNLLYINDWIKLDKLFDIGKYIIRNFQNKCIDIRIKISRLSPDKASILLFII